jgi:hypothetical protein
MEGALNSPQPLPSVGGGLRSVDYFSVGSREQTGTTYSLLLSFLLLSSLYDITHNS